jgi:hypothetical protein
LTPRPLSTSGIIASPNKSRLARENPSGIRQRFTSDERPTRPELTKAPPSIGHCSNFAKRSGPSIELRSSGAQELLLGSSGPEPPDAQLDKLIAGWREIADGYLPRLTIRLIAEGRDERRDISGGSGIPRAADEDGETARVLAGAGTD